MLRPMLLIIKYWAYTKVVCIPHIEDIGYPRRLEFKILDVHGPRGWLGNGRMKIKLDMVMDYFAVLYYTYITFSCSLQ